MASYDKYLKRLRQQKTDSSTMDMYSKGANALASTGNYIANKMSGLRLGNTSASARAAMQQQAQEQIGQQTSELYTNAMQQQAQQNKQLDAQIMNLQMAQDQYNEQKKKEKQTKGRQLITAVGQLGGAAIGALVGGIPGAQIGAGIGQAVGSVAPTRGNVPIDIQGAVQGASDAFIGYAGYANEKSMQNKMKMVGSSMPQIAKMSTEKLGQFIPLLKMTLMNNGSEDDINSLINSYIDQEQIQVQPNGLFNAPNYNLGGK